MVWLGLMDPASIFVKQEGHGAEKQLTKRWRLIWNISEPDGLLDFYDQEHADVLTHQMPRGVQSPVTSGVGHDDEALKRTYRDPDALLATGDESCIYCSDSIFGSCTRSPLQYEHVSGISCSTCRLQGSG